jgi:hypothetical protein
MAWPSRSLADPRRCFPHPMGSASWPAQRWLASRAEQRRDEHHHRHPTRAPHREPTTEELARYVSHGHSNLYSNFLFYYNLPYIFAMRIFLSLQKTRICQNIGKYVAFLQKLYRSYRFLVLVFFDHSWPHTSRPMHEVGCRFINNKYQVKHTRFLLFYHIIIIRHFGYFF